MHQHPRVTLRWAMEGLERAISRLPDGADERRVRAQFHQLLLAMERTQFLIDLPRPSPLPQPVRARSIHPRR